MATNLQVDEALSATLQAVKDKDGKVTPLLLATDRVLLTTDPVTVAEIDRGKSVLSIISVPADKRAHLQLGNPNATEGQPSARLSFAGFGIEHAGFAWVPHGQHSLGKLHLTFGGSDDPSPRGPQPARVTFQANGSVGIGTTDPTEVLEVNGNILATGDVRLAGADCAEEFNVDADEYLEPGTVLVIADQDRLRQCHSPYDRKVAGIVSGACGRKPGIILGRQTTTTGRIPVALTGTVWCKVDAEYSPVETGDLLTTSATLGHAMKALEASRAFGAILGKALRSLPKGRGLIPVLVALH